MKMKFKIMRCVILGVIFATHQLALAHQFSSVRTFTNHKGVKIEAEIISATGKQVKLKRNGKVFSYPLSKLSPSDVAFIKKWVEKQAEEANAGSAGKALNSEDVARLMKNTSGSQVKKIFGLKDNFDAKWPDKVGLGLDVKIQIVKEDEKGKQFIYYSPNYKFISDVRLNKRVVEKFAALFEATREYCKALPISLMMAHVPGQKFRNEIRLFEHKSTYVSNGGPERSSGVFIGGKGYVMIPLSGLGLKKQGGSYRYNHKGSYKVLPHELTHQLTDYEYFASGANGWFTEGLAEYVAMTGYRSGKFMVKGNINDIKEYVTGVNKKTRKGRNLSKKISSPRLKKYMMQPYSSFKGDNANFNYGFSVLLTYYFFHLDGEKDAANIKAFLKALKEGKKDEAALAVLLNGRSWDELEKSVAKAWRSKGVKISFK